MQEQAVVPVDTDVSKDISDKVYQATGELFDRIAKSLRDAPTPLVQQQSPQAPQAKAWYTDPFSLLDSVGMGYKANPTRVTYETLRQMTEVNTLVGAIVQTRTNQMSTFCQEQENKYSVGHLIRFRDRNKRETRLSNGDRDRLKRAERYLTNMGQETSLTRPGLVNAMKMLTRDRLSYDQVNIENVGNRGGKLHESLVVDPMTIRIADQSRTNPRGLPIPKDRENSHIMYVQMMNGEILREFTARELSFCIANPRSSVKVGGYGFPEPQILIQTVTAHIWAEEWNRKAFSQGSTIKGVLNMKGNIDRQKYDAFKRQWMSQVGGIMNAWKTPIINSDGIEFVPMQMSNTEMGYQMWIEYLVKIACAIYQMDPSEINFDLRGSAGGQQPVFMGNNEAQQKLSKDRGLKPLLRFFEDAINRHIVHRIDEDLEVAFVGLDAKSEEQDADLRQKKGMAQLTINELRALDDMPPVPYGDIVANPTYMAYRQQMEAQQQQGGGGMPPAQPGGQPGQDQQQQPAQQPYANRFGFAGQPPTANAQQAAQKLQTMSQPQARQDQPMSEDDEMDIRMLRRNDWSSSVHSSIHDNDLWKANRGEGSRGGHIVGHTRSGKAVYGDSMAMTIVPPSEHPGIGDESGKVKRAGIGVHSSPHGSKRYLHYENGKPVAGLQVVSRDGRTAKVANVYVAPSYRRRGLATKLFERARRDFESLDHADLEHTSLAGRSWVNTLEKSDLHFEIDL